MACSSTCATQDHESFGACLRAKNLKTHVETPGTGYSPAAYKKWDKRIDSYKEARAQGILPSGTKQSQIDAAVKASDSTGQAFVAQ